MTWEFWKLIAIDVGVAAVIGIITCMLTKGRLERWLALIVVLVSIAISVGVQMLVSEHENQVRIAELQNSPYQSVLNRGSPVAVNIARAIQILNTSQMSTLAGGYLHIDDENEPICSFPVLAIDNAKRKVLATALVDPDGFWTAFCGQRYLDANRSAVARGVKITRVFLLSMNNAVKYMPTIQQNLDLKHVEVRVACLSRMQKMGFGEDFGIFDDSYAMFLDTWPTGTVRELRFFSRESTEDQNLQRARGMWDHIYQHSQVIKSVRQVSRFITQTCK